MGSHREVYEPERDSETTFAMYRTGQSENIDQGKGTDTALLRVD